VSDYDLIVPQVYVVSETAVLSGVAVTPLGAIHVVSLASRVAELPKMGRIAILRV
jgi:hypothetical protein